MKVGFVGRFFVENWRPPIEELRFAVSNGFEAIQIRSDRPGMIESEIRADLAKTGEEFRRAGVECVLEMLLRYTEPLRIPDALEANLSAIDALGVRRVHVHPAPGPYDADVDFVAELSEAVELAAASGLALGFEHNSREHPLFVSPDSCRTLFDSVCRLHFVWDLNHTAPEHLQGFAQFKDRLSLVHVSDTPLPETNHHLPLGMGCVDVSVICGVDVPVILEIGGLPVSGGYGRDTDDALITSRDHLLRACA